MERERGCHFHALHLLLMFLLSAGIALAADSAALAPPPWSVGDWWVVDCQVYNLGKISPSKPGWTPRQSWRFQVEGMESLEGEPHFIVSIHPEQHNSCPYWFRFWFDASTRNVSRYELHHPEPTASKPRQIEPSVVEHDLSGADPTPFFTSVFPALPLSVPLFNVNHENASFPAGRMESDIHQVIEAVDAAEAITSADPKMMEKVAAIDPNSNRLVRIATPSDVVEQQYWNTRLPWCTYGERIDKGQIMRRYWLVETGKN